MFSNAFDLVRHDRLFTKIAVTGMDLRVAVWVKEFLLGLSQRVGVHGKLSEEVRVTSGVQQGSVLRPLLYLVYVNDIWKNLELNIRIFAYDYIIYRKIMGSSDVDKFHKGLKISAEWVVKNELKVNPDKSRTVGNTKFRAKKLIRYYFGDQLKPDQEALNV